MDYEKYKKHKFEGASEISPPSIFSLDPEGDRRRYRDKITRISALYEIQIVKALEDKDTNRLMLLATILEGRDDILPETHRSIVKALEYRRDELRKEVTAYQLNKESAPTRILKVDPRRSATSLAPVLGMTLIKGLWQGEHGVIAPFLGTITKSADGKSFYISGIASDTLTDLDGDAMTPKALDSMARTINTEGVPMFLDHEHTIGSHIGMWNQAEILGDKLKVTGKLEDPDFNPKVKQILTKLDSGANLGLSIGGDLLSSHNEDGIRKLDDTALYEISVVALPANPRSRVLGTEYKSKSYNN